MNCFHHWFCRSERSKRLAAERVTWALRGLTLGPEVLELGPGFEVIADLIAGKVERLTCVEIDAALTQDLRERLADSNVTIVCEDATSLSLGSSSFNAVFMFCDSHKTSAA